MAIAMALTVSQTLFAALQCKELRELCSMFGYKSDLDDLQRTASTIRAVLLDADSKLEGLSYEARDWIEKLKDAVYDVDDLLDEFNTIVQRNKLLEQTDDGKNKMMKKISKKVCRFFSRSNELIVAVNTSLDVKKIRKKLDAIASDHSKFGFSVNNEPSKKTRKETWSYVNEDRIIGREGDKEAVVRLLLQDHSTFEENVSFVSIVGIGGLWKTALAQIVYNDDRFGRSQGFELRFWVCVSEEFGVKEILSKMLMSATNQKCDDLGIDQLQKKVREQIQGKRYLLVLDDVWCESRNDWGKLKDFFICGGRGSRILVTARSKLVARAIGNHPVYDLNGLSPEDSWRLFAQMAFDNGGQEADAKLFEIGQEIVGKCANVPLALRVAGSLLYGQDMRKWQLFKEVNLPKIRDGEDDTMAILKLSYNHLSPSLKSCFSYCALFPKDYEIHKDLLINLWLAHGCIEPEYEGQNIEEVGEENFSILLNRCFFQEIVTDFYGDIYACKMHDLIHDLAQEVAGDELLLCSSGHFDRKLRHLSICGTLRAGLFNESECAAQVKTMRTCLVVHPFVGLVGDSIMSLFVSNCRYLRVLDLHQSSIKILPSTIGELVHLRYIDLSGNGSLQMLPNSITKLHNLEVLLLRRCFDLKALPEKLSRLVNLRVLDIYGFNKLTHMPGGIDKLTCLQRLTMFAVGRTNSKQMKVSHLGDLEALVQLGGNLTIRFHKYWSEYASEVMEGTCYPLIKSRLKCLDIWFFDSSARGEDEEAALEGLQPNHHLREIKIQSYKAGKLPSWISVGNSLRNSFPCLVVIALRGFSKLHCLPSMRQLCHLKRLALDLMNNLEYVEDENSISSSSASSSTSVSSTREDREFTFFPSLEELSLARMPKLKGWWRSHNEKPCPVADDDDVIGGSSRDSDRKQAESAVVTSADDVVHLVPVPVSSSLLSFPCLRGLEISKCPNLTSLPSCPHVQELHLLNNRLISCSFMEKYGRKRLVTYKIGWYKNFLDEEFAQGVVSLTFRESEEESMCSTNAIETIHFLQSCSSSLQHLDISDCRRLKRVGRGVFQHLTNLQSLRISCCENLSIEEEDDDEWKYLKSLSSLKLDILPKLINLPKGIQYLIALGSFHIWKCDNLASLPEWLSSLTSLTQLRIIDCDGLTERCRGPNGEDWPKIRHIPSLTVEYYS